MRFHAFLVGGLGAVAPVVCPTVTADPPGLPLILYVDDDAPGGGDGLSWATAYADLHLALDHVRASPDPDGNIIRMAEGVYRPYEFGQTARMFAVPSNTTIRGGFLPEFGNPRDPVNTPTIITGDIKGDDTAEGGNRTDNANTVIAPVEGTSPNLVPTVDVIIDGLTIERAGQGGYFAFGAGVRTTIRNCAFRFNYGPSSFRIDTTLQNSDFEDNFAAAFSVAAYNAQSRPTREVFTVAQCAFRRNGRFLDEDMTWDGAMIFRIDGAQVHAIDCTFDEHPYGSIHGTSGIYLADPRTFLPTGSTAYSHVFERCTFTGIPAQLISQRQETTSIQSVALRECRLSSLAAGLSVPAVISLEALDTDFSDLGAVIVLRPSRFSRCSFRDVDAFDVSQNSGATSLFASTLFEQCTFHNWHADTAPGIAAVRDCTFTGEGRAIAFSTVLMERCNVAMAGDHYYQPDKVALVYASTALNLIDCDFHGCDGSAVAYGPLVVDSCTFVQNTSNVVLRPTTPAPIVNSLFAGNNGVVMSAGCKVSNCTLVNNANIASGGWSGQWLRNCVVWGNRNGFASDSIEEQQLGSYGTYGTIESCLIEGWTGTFPGVSCFSAEPEFLDPLGPDGLPGTGDEDYRLSVFSPAIDAGNASLLPTDAADLDGDADVAEPVPFDLDGNARIIATPMYEGVPGAALDIGAYEYQADCNDNGVFDLEDIEVGTSPDCNGNLIPDDCEADCDGDGILDECELTDGLDFDCNANGLPDSCDILVFATSLDCNENGIPDECEPDCNGNGIPDECDLGVFATSDDCNLDGVPDECRAEVGYTVDDGGSYANQNIVIYPVNFERELFQTLILTQQVVEPGGETIHEVEFFGGSREERSLFVVVYDDPNNDGDPHDAVLLGAFPVIQPWTTYTGDAAYRTQSISPTHVGEAGDSFFVGVWVQHEPDPNGLGLFGAFVRSACEEERCFVGLDVHARNPSGPTPSSLRSMEQIRLSWFYPLWNCANPPTHNSTPAMSMHIRARTLHAYDCDLDLSPDVCGPFPDINGNGVPDGCECPGDVTGDGRTDVYDLTVLALGFGRADAFWFDGDLTGDGAVDVADFCILAAQYGDVCKEPPPTRLPAINQESVFAFPIAP